MITFKIVKTLYEIKFEVHKKKRKNNTKNMVSIKFQAVKISLFSNFWLASFNEQ